MTELNEKIIYKDGLELAKENYKEYGLTVARGRAYPSITDGCKSSYKRAIYGMWKDGGRKQQKVAELAAYALPYHPHPTSVAGVIIQLGDRGNKLKLMDTQGNWGNSSKGIQAAAERYIGGRLSDLAIQLLCEDIEYCNYITGEIDNKEPEALPALIPLCFINGQSGIPAGLPRMNIPPLNLVEMADYYIKILENENLDHKPRKLPTPNIEIDVLSSIEDWEQIMKTGKGQIRVAPVMQLDDQKITITQLPSSKNVESVRKLVESEILADKIDFIDLSTDELLIVIEKVYKKQCDMKQLYNKLYKKLQTTESYNMAFFDQEYIYVPCAFHQVVKKNLEYLLKTQENRITLQLEAVKKRIAVLEIIQQLKARKLVHGLVDMTASAACRYIVDTFKITDEIAKQVLQKPISYLTKEHDKELQEFYTERDGLEKDLQNLWKVLLRRYRKIKSVFEKLDYKPTRFLK